MPVLKPKLTADVAAGDMVLPVSSVAGFAAADAIWLERTGANEEQTTVVGVGTSALNASVAIANGASHPSGSFVTPSRRRGMWRRSSRKSSTRLARPLPADLARTRAA